MKLPNSNLRKQDPAIKGIEKFPASLTIKSVGERKYSLEKDF